MTPECLDEDDLLALVERPAMGAEAEAHLAACAECSALLAGAMRARPRRAWDALAGTQLAGYRIDAQIGEGGMGAVYRAWDERLGRAIAIKVLHAPGDDLADEARAAAAIDHRAVVGVYDVGVADGVAYVAMELASGESLRSAIARGPVGIARTVAYVRELVDALAAAHARGIVHRDLKPENLLAGKGGLRVLDFGLARGSGSSGTVGYMAPEQLRAEPCDARADLFAVGAIAYELATGARAFPGDTRAERVRATLLDEPAADPALAALAPIVMRCLAKAPADRFQSAADLGWALDAITAARPAAARGLSRRGLLAGGLAAAAAGAIGYVIGGRRSGAVPASGSGSGSPYANTMPSAATGPRPLTHRVGRVSSARFTRDGGRLLYGAAWDGARIAIHALDLASLETVALDLPSAEILAISAHNELAVSLDHRFVDHQSARGALAIVPLAGGPPRPYADDIQEAEFFPDGTLAVVRAAARGYRIDHPLGTALATAAPGWITSPRLSPDGTRLAYLRHPHSNDDGGDIVLLDLQPSPPTERVLSTKWQSLAGLAWTPAGDALWFAGARGDLGTRLQRLPLATPDAAQPHPVQLAGRIRIHDVAHDGRIAVTADAWRLRAMIGDRDHSMSDVSYVSDISADGAWVSIGELGDLDGGGAYLVPAAAPDKPLHLGAGYPVAISPSGTRIAANLELADHLVVYSTASGETPQIPTPGFVTFARWLDETALVAAAGGALYRIAIGTAPVELAAGAAPFALDPARTHAAFVDEATGTLRILDLAARTTRTLPGTFARDAVCGWLATGAIAVRSTTTPIEIATIDPTTGARHRHATVSPPRLGLKGVDSFILHPAGALYTYSYGEELSQLFVLPG